MRVPLSWLKDFLALEEPPERLAHALSFLGLVVEATEVVPAPFEGIVVARVLQTRPHGSADRVQLVDVDAGDGDALQIVCGAFNMRPGDLVPLATLGTKMPDGREIARRKVRGEWSNGMLCSAAELGLGTDGPEPAIYILSPGVAAPGQAFSEAFGFGPDVVFDLEISPNRGDCFSIAGVARDLSAALDLPLAPPAPLPGADETVERANVFVAPEAEDLCPRFTGTVFERVQAAQVAPMVQRRLVLAGMRPINPVVDVSNYVMLELGQPNHPYDISSLGGRGLVVRRGKPGEELVTLDGVTRELSSEDLVISDAQGVAAGLAGIMGGSGSGIGAGTQTILLEVANFDPRAISATGKRLGITSEARSRFERGVDIELPVRAVGRFAELLGPAVKRGPTVDLCPRPRSELEVGFRPARANLVLGTSLSAAQCAGYLGRLGFKVAREGGDKWDFLVPSWRYDTTREIDLVEEVARIYGYERVGRELPPRRAEPSRLAAWQLSRRRLREVLTGTGASEAWTSSFVSARDLELAGLGPAGAVQVENPLDSSQALLRPSLLPGLIKAARSNFERQARTVSLFELGEVFSYSVADGASAAGPAAQGQSAFEYRAVKGVVEWEQVGLVAFGPGADAAHAARLWEVVARAFKLGRARLSPWSGRFAHGPVLRGAAAAASALHPGRRSLITVEEGRRVAGVAGELDPEIAARNGFPGRVAVVLADLAALFTAPAPASPVRPLSRYPAVDLDMAFVVASDVTAGELWETIASAAGELAEEVALFDVWADASLGEGRRSLAFRARLRALDRTLTEAEAAEVRSRVAQAVAERHGGELRGGPAGAGR